MATIGFIGLGNMGAPMAANLLRAGHAVRGYDLSPVAASVAADLGVDLAGSAHEAVAGADLVITMLPAGKHVTACYADILPAATPGSLFIDCSTIDVAAAQAAHAAAAAAGMASVDAPVSGGVGGAKAGTLTFMAGAPKRRSPGPNRSWPPWARRSCAVARLVPARRRRSATT